MPRRYRKKFRRRGRGLRALASGSFKRQSLRERHIADGLYDGTAVPELPGASPGNSINMLAAGTGIGNRIGRRISMKSFHVKGFLHAYSGTAPTTYQIPPAARILIYYDKEHGTTGGGRSPENIDALNDGLLDPAPASANQETDFYCLKTWHNRERYVVLVDRIVPLTTSSLNGLNSTGMLGQAHFDFYVKLKGLQAIYNGDAIVDPTNGQLCMCVVKNAPTADGSTSYVMKLHARWRLQFYA